MSIIECRPTPLDGCVELQPIVRGDCRGAFVKTYHVEAFTDLGLPTVYREEYHSVSVKNVLRGLHFQMPPFDCGKLVYVAYGKVWDVAVDLRCNSSTYGQYYKVILDAEKANMLYIPKGFAHGFYTLSDQAVMMYKVTEVYSAKHDTGILWNSVGIDWPCQEPIVSERDSNFISWSDFVSPFR